MNDQRPPDPAACGAVESENPRASGSEAVRCSSSTKSGARCKAWALPGSELCAFHAVPADVQRARSAAGGRSRSNRVRASRAIAELPAMDAVAIGAAVTRWIRQVEAGQLDIGRAAALGSLARVALAALPAVELGDLEQRIAALENGGVA